MTNDDPAKQISMLLYCLGEGADTILTPTSASAGDHKDYATVIEKFDSFCVSKNRESTLQ